MGRNKIVPHSMCNWLLLLVFIMQFIVSLCIKEVWSVFSNRPLNGYNYILAVEILAVALPAVLLCLFNGSSIVRSFGIKSMKFSKVWKCICLGICLQPVAVLINSFWQGLINVQGTSASAVSGIEEMLVVFAVTCIVPAFSEEFLLRGMYLSAVKKNGYAYTIIVTTVMFVLLHSDVSTLAAHIILGATCAFAVLNTNSVFAGILVHLSFNMGGMLMDYTAAKGLIPGFFGSTYEFMVVAGIAALVLAVLLYRGVYSPKVRKVASTQIVQKLFKAFFNVPVLIIIAIYILLII